MDFWWRIDSRVRIAVCVRKRAVSPCSTTSMIKGKEDECVALSKSNSCSFFVVRQYGSMYGSTLFFFQGILSLGA